MCSSVTHWLVWDVTWSSRHKRTGRSHRTASRCRPWRLKWRWPPSHKSSLYTTLLQATNKVLQLNATNCTKRRIQRNKEALFNLCTNKPAVNTWRVSCHIDLMYSGAATHFKKCYGHTPREGAGVCTQCGPVRSGGFVLSSWSICCTSFPTEAVSWINYQNPNIKRAYIH